MQSILLKDMFSLDGSVSRYQCSEHSSSRHAFVVRAVRGGTSLCLAVRREVQETIERALKKQEEYEEMYRRLAVERASKSGPGEAGDASVRPSRSEGVRRVAVVFMDEAGLPSEARESLKVVHAYLDKPNIGFVAISNNALDPAKMNRCVCCTCLWPWGAVSPRMQPVAAPSSSSAHTRTT